MTEKMNVAKIFGENVFNDKVMQELLPPHLLPSDPVLFPAEKSV